MAQEDARLLKTCQIGFVTIPMRTVGAHAAHCLPSRLLKRRCAYMAIAAFIFTWTAMIMIYVYSRGSLRHVTRSLSPPLPPVAGNMTVQMQEIRAAASAAWRAYAATGMTADDARPLAGGAESSLRVRATLYDSLGTLFVMGLREEYEQAVAEVLRLGAPRTFIYQTSSFEYNIRVVGGLLSAAQLSGDRRLLVVAEEAAHTLLSSSYLLWPSSLPIGRVRMQPLTPLNFPIWLIARVMDVSWYMPLLLHCVFVTVWSGTCTSACSSDRSIANSPESARTRSSCAHLRWRLGTRTTLALRMRYRRTSWRMQRARHGRSGPNFTKAPHVCTCPGIL